VAVGIAMAANPVRIVLGEGEQPVDDGAGP